MTNELELRAQTAYRYVHACLMQTIDDCANVRASLAVRDEELKEAREKLAAAEARIAELTAAQASAP
jgi:hypothetical protein